MRTSNPTPAQQAILVALGFGTAVTAVWLATRRKPTVTTSIQASSGGEPPAEEDASFGLFDGEGPLEPEGQAPADGGAAEAPASGGESEAPASGGEAEIPPSGSGGEQPAPKPTVTDTTGWTIGPKAGGKKPVGAVAPVQAAEQKDKLLVTIYATPRSGAAHKYDRVAKVIPAEGVVGGTVAAVGELSNTDVADPHVAPYATSVKVSNLKLGDKIDGGKRVVSFDVTVKTLGSDGKVKSTTSKVTGKTVSTHAGLSADGLPTDLTAATVLALTDAALDSAYEYRVAVGRRAWTDSSSKVVRKAAAAGTGTAAPTGKNTKRVALIARRYGKESAKQPTARAVRVLEIEPGVAKTVSVSGNDGTAWSADNVTVLIDPNSFNFIVGSNGKPAVDQPVLASTVAGEPKAPLVTDPPKASKSGERANGKYSWTRIADGTSAGDLTLFLAYVT